MNINFPSDFPTTEQMLDIMHKTVEKSWKKSDELDLDKFNNWLDNFTGIVYDVETERRLMLWLLCNFTYYSENDINHLCGYLFRKFIHVFVKKNNINPNIIESELSNVYFLPGGTASESGGLLLYHFRQEANLSIDKFSYILSPDITANDTFVFIDDVTISGSSAGRMFNDKVLSYPHKNIYYLTIIASPEAIKKLEERGIITVYCYLLDDRNRCFSDDSIIYSKFPSLKDLSQEIAVKYGEKIINEPDEPLGFKSGGYCFGFFYNTPNNTLPIFWSKKNWFPIFERKDKLYNAKYFHYNNSPYI